MRCRYWNPLRKWNGGCGHKPSGLFNTCPCCGAAQRRLWQRSHLLPERQSGGGHYPVERVQQNACCKKGKHFVREMICVIAQIEINICVMSTVFHVICRLLRMERNMQIWMKWPSCSTSMRIKMVKAETRYRSYTSCEDWTLAVIATLFKTQLIMHMKGRINVNYVMSLKYFHIWNLNPLHLFLFFGCCFFSIQEKSLSHLPATTKLFAHVFFLKKKIMVKVWLSICFSTPGW